MPDNVTDVEIEQMKSMVQTHHGKLNDIEKTLGKTPDPETLRAMEHTYKELPSTDDLKEVVKARSERSAMFKRVTWGVMATVAGVIALSVLAMIKEGIAMALRGGS